MNRPSLAAALIALAAVAGGGCSSSGANEVAMGDGLDFNPEAITASAGESITFSNQTSVVHTVTAYEESLPAGADYFASGGFSGEAAARDRLEGGFIETGDVYELTLDQPGTYEYFCIPHEGASMKGSIRIEE